MLHTSFCLLLATVCASIIPSLAASTGNSVYDVHFERLRQRRTSFRRHRRRDGPSSLPAGQTSIVTSDFRSCADAPAGYSLSEANVMHSTTTPLSCKYKDNSSSDYKYCFYDNNGDSTSGSGFFGTATMTCPPMSFARNDGDQCFTSCPDSHDSKFILSPNDSSVIFIAPATDMFTRCWYTDGSSDVRICDFKATTGGFNAESSPSPEEDCPSASLLDGQCVSPKTGANLPPPPPPRA